MARVVRFHETGGPEVLKIEEVEIAPPGPGEVEIEVKALGVNRAESMFRTGQYLESPVFPARLGYEAAGILRAIGQDVTGLAIGDAVSIVPPLSITRWGAYGESATVPASAVVKHPASLSWIDAAAVWMQYITAWGALIDLAQVEKRDTVTITAASSSVGLAAIQVANAAGATTIATTRTRAKRDALLEFGADHVVVTDEEDLVERVSAITDGALARVAFDPIAGPGIEPLAASLAQEGMLIEYGALSPDPTPLPLFALIGKRLGLHGYQYKRVVSSPERFERGKRFVLDGLESGQLKPKIDKVFAFDDIVEAHRYLESNRQFGKIVVTV